MKCPKCGYLGFERVERCRNCGYDFLLTDSPNVPELSIRVDGRTDEQLLDDLSLFDQRIPEADVEGELPSSRSIDDRPMITRPSPPRQPLSVRRATPEVPRLRTAPARMPMLDLAAEPDPALPPIARVEAEEWHPAPVRHGELEAASLYARLAAGAIDLLILAAIDAVVIYFTMKICGLTVEDVSILPKAPLLAFLLVQNGSYLVAFTAGGQTLGKMVAGIKVVPASDGPLDLGHSVMRTIVWAVLAIPAGLGFLTAFLSRDRRGLHDRFAGTRVVRATL
jgi:uncharacterized RDD family membrane protein YckC